MDDMNATPVTKLQAPTLLAGNDGGMSGSGGPPSYSELLKEMNGPPQQPRFGSSNMAIESDEDTEDIEEIRELPPRSRAVRFAPMAAMQPVQQYGGGVHDARMNAMNMPQNAMNAMHMPHNMMNMQMPQAMPQHVKPSAKARKAETTGVKGFMMKHKTILIIAIAAFLAMSYGAPRLRTIPQFVSASGGLNMLGIAALSLAVGASSELAKLVN